jgi:uncharacterized protein with beta-barrel porin domain
VSADGLYSYHALAGTGSDTFGALNEGRSWRAALLGTVATGALWLMAPRPAQAGPGLCTVTGAGIITCTGDQSDGIAGGPLVVSPDFDSATVDTLYVNSLTTDIAPPAGVSGIYFKRTTGDITINSDTSPFSISVSGFGLTNGIYAQTLDGVVTVNHTGDITSADTNGIRARSFNGAVHVTANGDLTVDDNGIGAIGTDDVSVTHTGNIDSSSGYGIYAAGGGTTEVRSYGNITAGISGIYAEGDDGVTVIHANGDIDAGNTGISGHSGGGTVTIDSTGNITATNYYGIHAVGSTEVDITHSGDISSGGTGISGDSGGGTTYVKDTGNITAGDDGIYAGSFSGATVKHYGGTINAAGTGIEANATNSPVSVTNHSNIAAGYRGIYAITGGDIDITQIGAITAVADDGIRADSTSGTVNIDSTGDITANGAGAYGIFAQSSGDLVTVTGSGDISAGADGIHATSAGTTYVPSVTHTVDVKWSGDIAAAAGYGIFAQANNGTVAVTDSGNIVAQNDGIYAYSEDGTTINHDGGNITSATGDGIYARSGNNYADVTNSGDITAAGDGIFAKSSGTVTVTNTGNIVAGVDGIHAEGTYDVSVTHHGNISANGFGIYSFAYGNLSVDQSGDITAVTESGIRARSSFGTVDVISTGDITAGGHGIYAFALNDAVTVTHTGDINGTGDDGIHAGSNGGPITITNDGDIIGAVDFGILAQNLGTNGQITITQTGDIIGAGDGGIHARTSDGAIDISNTGNITAGENGIFALTSQGDVTIHHAGNIAAGEYGMRVHTNNGAVEIVSTGDITASLRSGIYASATGNIAITVNGGTVYSGGGVAYAGIQVVGGSLNTITIGKSATAGGKNWAILGGTGVEFVNNYGTVVGNVDLGGGGGPNGFFNRAGGRFESGTTVDIGTSLGSTFFNAGTLSPGGTGAVQMSTFTVGTGLVQGASGSLEVDVDLANGQADRVTIGGTGIAQLAGTVKPHLMSFGATPQTFTILSAFGVTDQGLTLQDSAVVDYRLIVNPGDVQLQIAGISFVPSGLTPNQQATATNLQQSFLVGGGGLSDLLLSLANEDFAAFAADLDHLHPEAYLAQTQALLWSGFGFGNSLFSCPTPSGGASSILGEESCYWLRPSGRIASLSSHDGYFGFRESAAGLTGGVQGELAPHWYLDMGAGYERSDIDTDTSSARGNIFHGGAALKYIRERWLFAGSLSGSFARYDTSRFGIPTAGTATADADTAALDARLRIAYAFGNPSFYMKPMVDFDLTGLWRGAIDETGAGALSLHIEDETDWIASAAPAVEIGREWRHGDTIWRPYVRLGVRFLSEGDVAATASFAGAPTGVPPFTVTSPLDRTLAEVSAGVDVWKYDRLSLRVSYDGRFGAHASDNGGAVKLRARF